jgi:hypothetical protein
MKIEKTAPLHQPGIFQRLMEPLIRLWSEPLFKIALVVGLMMAAFMAGAFAHQRGYIFALRQEVDQAVDDVVDDVQSEVATFINNDELPTLYIDMPFESYQQILDKRTEALEMNVLLTSDEDMVPAQVRYEDGDSLDAKMRLKGDWTDHLEGDKWSYRVHMTGDGQAAGMRRFSIQDPSTRNYMNEWAFHQHMISEGVLTTRYQFVNVVFNGEALGIYAMEESFSGELLESQGRRQGVILRFDEDLYRKNIATFAEIELLDQAETMGMFMVANMDNADITLFRSGAVERDPILTTEAQTAVALLSAFQSGEKNASEVFDVALMGRFFALADFWGAGHTTNWRDIRFYYNPITGLLEPISYDALPLRSCCTRDELANVFIDSRMFTDPQIQAVYAQELERITKAEYVQELIAELKPSFDAIQHELGQEFEEGLEPPWATLRERAQVLRHQLNPAQPVRGTYYRRSSGDEDAVLVELVNMMILPVELLEMQIGDVHVVPELDWVTEDNGMITIVEDNSILSLLPAQDRSNASARLLLPFKLTETNPEQESLDPQVHVVVRIAGLPEEYVIPLREKTFASAEPVETTPEIPGLAEVLQQHPFLEKMSDEQSLAVKPGDWNVEGDLILPEGIDLFIPPGTTLRFEPNAILYSSGSLTAAGTNQAPVVLTAQGEDWSGIAVIRAQGESIWEYTTVEKTSGINRGGWILTGGITFYESNISLIQSRIINTQAEDAINLIHGEFKFNETEFAFTGSDAFDSDFSSGEITGCFFQKISGDAIDFSGSNVSIEDTTFIDIGDKAISVGEESEVIAQSLYIESAGIGVASKDLSNVTLDQVQIVGAEHAGLAAYIKKPVYGPATIQATNTDISETAVPTLVQTGSRISLNHYIQRTEDLNVDELYERGILGN